MAPHRSPGSSLSVQVTLAALVVGTLSILLLAGYAIFSAARIDELATARERTLVKRSIADQMEALGREQESVTVWDDAVTFSRANDQWWMAENMGEWMHAFYKHDRVYVLNETDAPVHAMVDGKTVSPDLFQHDAELLRPLVQALRTSMADAESLADAAVSDVLKVDSIPSIVSIRPIVPSSDRVHLPAGMEYIYISVREIGDEMLSALGTREMISNVHYQTAPSSSSEEASYTLLSSSGEPLGYVVWTRDRPGAQLIKDTAPGLLALSGGLVGLMALLVIQLRRVARRLARAQAHTEHLAFHDTLTDLPNRAFFNDSLDRTLAARIDGETKVALHYVDLDRFKHVNDTLGHPAGDELIRQVAARLQALMGPNDIVARLGGDEFAIVQAEIHDAQEAGLLARRMLDVIRQPFELAGDQAIVGASIGIALASDASAIRTELMRMADIALYEAKGTGKNRYCLFALELDDLVRQKRRVERDLREALESGEGLHLAYQPLYAADGRSVIGAEALLRWEHPVQGALSPAVFVPVAEERGLIVQLGDWVLQEACKMAREIDLPWIAVNVSATQLREASFPARVLGLLREHGLTGHRLQLEITEGVLLDGSEEITHSLAQLRALGICIALDDFGTGYSSLHYLHRYSVDKIKIDRSFVSGIGKSKKSQAIVKAMMDMARAFDMEVTAEGVETTDQWNELTALGCQQLQGFLFSAAIPPDELHGILGASARKATA